jgi:serine/threonine protein phosphatase PrpC
MRLNDGSTAVCCVLREGKLHIANVGDSRAILVSGGKGIPLTKDHKPAAPEEQRRIASFGGVITHNTGIPRVQGVLAVSRAFGNFSIRQFIRADPDIFTRDVSLEDDFLVLASDGLWDVYRNAEVAEICYSLRAQGCRAQRISDHLVQNALLRGSLDNVTCVVVCLTGYTSRILSESPVIRSLNEIPAPKIESAAASRGNVLRYERRNWDQEENLEEDLEANVSVYYSSAAEESAGRGDVTEEEILSLFVDGNKGQRSHSEDVGQQTLVRSRSTKSMPKQTNRRLSEAGIETDFKKDQQSLYAESNSEIMMKRSLPSKGIATMQQIQSEVRGGADNFAPPNSSAYRSLGRPMTSSAAIPGPTLPLSLLENGNGSVSSSKPLFVPSAFVPRSGGNVPANGEVASDSNGYAGSRSYVLVGGNSMAPKNYDRAVTADGSARGQGGLYDASSGAVVRASTKRGAELRGLDVSGGRPSSSAGAVYSASGNRQNLGGLERTSHNSSGLSATSPNASRPGPPLYQPRVGANLLTPHSPINTSRKK